MLIRQWLLLTIAWGWVVCDGFAQSEKSSPSSVSRPFYCVTDFGAVGDGATKATAAFSRAIDAASAAGGGTVIVPAGTYLTGPIHLKSNITLNLQAGARLNFTNDFVDYLPAVQTCWEGTPCMGFSPLIYGYQLENVAVVGRGIIDGCGRAWWDMYRQFRQERKEQGKITTWTTAQKTLQQTNKNKFPEENRPQEALWLRPTTIEFYECANVRIEGVMIMNSPFWTVHPTYCDNVTIEGITIKNPANSPNTDGVNPDGCRNVHISNCHISVGDDCVTIKSGRDEAGRKMNRPCENITVTNCTMLDGHGGVVIGSEMSGGVRNVVISNCIFDGTERGIRIKTTRGRGGIVENIRVCNIVMRNITLSPIWLNMAYTRTRPEPVSERTPTFRNIHFANITSYGSRYAGYLKGLEEMPIDNVTFTNIDLQAHEGFSCNYSQHMAFNNVKLEIEKGPLISADHVQQLEINALKTRSSLTPMMNLDFARDVLIHNCIAPVAEKNFIKTGEGCECIAIINNYLGLPQKSREETGS